VFHLASEFIKNSGYPNPTKFISNPATVEAPEPAPDPQLILAQSAQVEAQANAAKKQADAKLADEKFLWQKKVDAAEVTLEDSQKRPVGIQTGK
jgi:hypothetical protein